MSIDSKPYKKKHKTLLCRTLLIRTKMENDDHFTALIRKLTPLNVKYTLFRNQSRVPQKRKSEVDKNKSRVWPEINSDDDKLKVVSQRKKLSHKKAWQSHHYKSTTPR